MADEADVSVEPASAFLEPHSIVGKYVRFLSQACAGVDFDLFCEANATSMCSKGFRV